MKKVKGVSHIHSTYSYDGRLTLRELKKFFLKRGFQFLLLTEHIEKLDRKKIDSLIKECTNLSDENFVFVPGIEIDKYKLIILGIRKAIEFRSPEEFIEKIIKQRPLFVLAHPILIKKEIPEKYSNLVEGCEIWNLKYDSPIIPRTSSLNLIKKLNMTKKVFGILGLDFHEREDFHDASINMAIKNFTAKEIVKKIKAGKFMLKKKNLPVEIRTDFKFLKTSDLFRSTILSLIFDVSFKIHEILHKDNIPVPENIKLKLKGLIYGK